MTSAKSNRPKLKKAAGIILPVVLMILLTILAFWNIELEHAFSLVLNSSIGWMLVFILVFFASHIVRAARFKVMLKSSDSKVSLLNALGSTMIGYGVNCAVPRLGELYRALFLGKWVGMSRTSLFGTVIVERVMDIIALGVSVLISVLIFAGDLYNEIPWLKSAVYFGFAIMGMIILIIYLLVKYRERFYTLIIRIVEKISKRASEKISYVFDMLISGFDSVKGAKSFTKIIIHSALIMLLYGLNSYIGFYMLRINEIQIVSFGMGWVVMTIAAFGVVIPTPGGSGSYHLITTSVLVSLYNVLPEMAAAYAFLTHFISQVLFVGSAIFFILFINKKRERAGYPKESFLSVLKNK